MLEPGQLVRVDRDLQVSSRIAIEHPPAHMLALEALDPGEVATGLLVDGEPSSVLRCRGG